MLGWWLCSWALAQEPAVPTINAQTYRAPVDARGTMWADSAGTVVDELIAAPRLVLHYTWRPLAYVAEDQDPVWLVSDVMQADAILATHYDRFRLSVYVPVYLYSAGQLTEDGAGLGDVGVDGRVTLLDPADVPLGLALHGGFRAPTSTVEASLGAAAFDTELSLAATHLVGDALELNANAGMRLGPRQELENVTLDDSFVWRVGGGYFLGEDGGLSLDLSGRAELADGIVAGVPVEGLIGGWFQASQDIAVKLGIGRGITEGIGSPQLRTLAMVAYQPRAASDRDLDGLVDRYDQCPNEPEDRDDFADDDGCPDPDNDRDGILDVADRCAEDPEDLDGYQDGDGCPDVSQSVAIQVQDPKGTVLHEASTRLEGAQSGLVGGGFGLQELHEGPYTVYASLDGYAPGQVAFEVPYEGERVVVVLQPAAVTGKLALTVIDPMGLPVEGATWAVDGAPPNSLSSGQGSARLPAGVHELKVEAAGFLSSTEEVEVPADGVVEHLVLLSRPTVRITETQIELQESIFFETGSAVIKRESHGVLEEVAGVLQEHPEIRKLRIEGHTDARGSAASNQRLSEARAASVLEFLVGRGVERERLGSVGYGETKPLVSGNYASAWEKNRRVDLFIEEQAD